MLINSNKKYFRDKHYLELRWFFDNNLNFEVNEKFKFIVNYDHNLYNYSPLPIDADDYNISIGILVKF